MHSCARALPSGAFLAPQRSQTYTVTWLKRPANQSSAQYLQLAKDSLSKASAQCCLAYRPVGRANLGIRGSPMTRRPWLRRMRVQSPRAGFDWGAHCLGSCRSLLLVD